MNAGHYISGVGHAGLIGLLLFGGLPVPESAPIEVSDVSIISSEEFAMLTATSVPPVTDSVEPQALQPPEEVDDVPDISEMTDTPPPVTEPEATEATPPDAVPDVSEIVPSTPEIATDISPAITPPIDDIVPPLPDIPADVRPRVRTAPRIAPTPVAPPEPDVQVDEVVREAAVPDVAAPTPTPEDQTTAPEEATVQTVPEDQQAEVTTSAAPTRSARPRSRPNRPQPTTATTTATNTNNGQSAAIAAALAEAAQSGTAPTPSGPPLTGGEKDVLRLAVSSCWNTGSLSSDALRSIVVVGFEMQENGKPVTASIRMLSSSGGTGAAVKQAYEAARRAIIRCGARGFNLPSDKYDHWREIEMTFNPEKMRIK